MGITLKFALLLNNFIENSNQPKTPLVSLFAANNNRLIMIGGIIPQNKNLYDDSNQNYEKNKQAEGRFVNGILRIDFYVSIKDGFLLLIEKKKGINNAQNKSQNHYP